MIEVIIRHKESKTELGRIEIENLSEEAGTHADYLVSMGVEKITGVGVHKRTFVNFPRREYNVLGLLLQALNTLEPEFLKLQGMIDEGALRKGLPWFFRGH